MSEPGYVIWRAWRDGMIRQGRDVAPERMEWETLPAQDKALDAAIEQQAAADAEARMKADLLKHGQINVGTVVGYEAGIEEGRRLATLLAAPPALDAAHLNRQREWSERTFGPGPRTLGVIDHIRKELREIEAEPTSLEWVDVVILALDGAWRAGHEPQAIIDAIVAKQAKNEARVWPDWRTASPDEAIEHDRASDARLAPERDG